MDLEPRDRVILGLVLGILVGGGLALFLAGRGTPEPPPEVALPDTVAELQPVPEDSVTPAETEEVGPLPEYSILGVVEELGAPTRGDVLVPSLSRETPASVRESVLRRIMKREGFDEAALFCSEDAMRAAYAETYQGESPGALQTCGLGQVGSDGRFNPWDAQLE